MYKALLWFLFSRFFSLCRWCGYREWWWWTNDGWWSLDLGFHGGESWRWWVVNDGGGTMLRIEARIFSWRCGCEWENKKCLLVLGVREQEKKNELWLLENPRRVSQLGGLGYPPFRILNPTRPYKPNWNCYILIIGPVDRLNPPISVFFFGYRRIWPGERFLSTPT